RAYLSRSRMTLRLILSAIILTSRSTAARDASRLFQLASELSERLSVPRSWLGSSDQVGNPQQLIFDPLQILSRERRSGQDRGILVVVTGNFLHEHHDPAPQVGIINSHERSHQP